MRVPDESEELEIDRLLQQLGIRLPPVDLSDDTQSAYSFDKDANEDVIFPGVLVAYQR